MLLNTLSSSGAELLQLVSILFNILILVNVISRLTQLPKWLLLFRRKNSSITIKTHCNDVIMGAISSQITSLMIVVSTVYLDTDQGKHQSPASLAFVRGIHRRPVNSPHKWPVTRKMFAFDHVIMDIFRQYNVLITRSIDIFKSLRTTHVYIRQ